MDTDSSFPSSSEERYHSDPETHSSSPLSDEHSNNDDETVNSNREPAKKPASNRKRKAGQEFDFSKYVGIIKKWKPQTGVGNKIRCEVCFKYPDTLKFFGISRRNSPISTEDGTGNRTDVLEAHLVTPYHIECLKRHIKDLKRGGEFDDGFDCTPLQKIVSAANAEKADTIGRYIMATYTDAKILTSSAYSWPARIFTNEYSRKYNINDPKGNREAMLKTNLQYMTPNSHSEFLECIVHVDRDVVAQKLDSCLAMSLRADGSIDRTNIDKIYVLAQIINAAGFRETLFLGLGEQTERGARGLFQTIISIVNRHGTNAWEKALKKMTSFVTDGASINVGEHNGLWRHIQDAAESEGALQPILMIWCAAHRSDLCIKDLGKSVPEVKTIIKMCSRISSFIRQSAVRLVEIKKIAAEKDVGLHLLPKHFEVRWSQFTLQLIDSTLTSWRCLVYFFEYLVGLNDKHSAEACGYSKFLKNSDNLQILCFLADLFNVHTKFQKQLQANDLNIIKLDSVVAAFKHNIHDLHSNTLLGGWEETLRKTIHENDDETYYVDDIEIRSQTKRVPSNRTFDFLRKEILTKILDFTSIRFSTDVDEACSMMKPFFDFRDEQASVRVVHKLLASDLDITDLYIQFKLICSDNSLKCKPLPNMLKHLVETDSTQSFSHMITVLARILAATPHSADVERSISANNLLKTPLRTRLKLDTENNYLFVHFNLPPFSEWNPYNAVLHWMSTKQRRVHNLTVDNENRRSKKQPHFKGVFPQVSECQEGKENEDEDNVIVLKPKSNRQNKL